MALLLLCHVCFTSSVVGMQRHQENHSSSFSSGVGAKGALFRTLSPRASPEYAMCGAAGQSLKEEEHEFTADGNKRYTIVASL